MKICLFLLFLSLVGCASAPKLSKEGEEVTFMKPKVGKCDLIKERLHIFTWLHKRSSKVWKNKLQNEAAKMGGNVLELLEAHYGSDQAIANVYKCPLKYILEYKSRLR